MTRNIGNLDRGLRVLVAVIAVIAALLVGAGSVVGIVLIVVALCPLYKVLHLNTRSGKALPR
jgi:Mg2+/citrate symporter